jgi:hypothetical protein
MAYVSGSLIEATDYNGFVSTTFGANVNFTWNTSYGQTALSTVSTGGTVTATQWATLVNTISSMAAHQGTTITSRAAPVTGGTISILAAVNTDINRCFNAIGNATLVGSQYTSWTGTNSKTSSTSGATWTITITNTVTFASANAMTWFFNAGGILKLEFGKSSTGQTGDPEWNDLLNTLCGDLYITAGIYGARTIVGTSYTGTNKIGGTGTPTTLDTGFGGLDATSGLPNKVIYKQFADTAPYTGNYVEVRMTSNGTPGNGNILTITTFFSASDGDPISGGTAASGATPGTAPCAVLTYFPPSTTWLSASWGTPTIAATTA